MFVTVGSWKQLADILITTDELDPVYTFAVRLGDREGARFLQRFMMSFFMFYDLKGAIDAAERTDDNDFWAYIRANYDALPRGSERRHSRGSLGRKFVENMAEKGPPSQIWWALYKPTYHQLVVNVGQNFVNCGVGPYFTWKLMDIFDRVFGRPVSLSFDEAVKWLPPEPREAAKLGWPRTNYQFVLQEIAEYVECYNAPGVQNRKCSYSEAETILCAVKGFWFGKYEIGDDLRRRHRELSHYPDYKELLSPLLTQEYGRGPALDA